ncbi:MAG: hypothetical protein RID09_30735 [Coleofasciculus sp. G1-WW12-02]|uniref:hypothetical protein n=1 Tax=Coleofasciculus sp. G1-WW12-02 TaxID=3068483 RepID=UPI0032F4E0D9
MNRIRQLSLYLTAGAIGALVNSLAVWIAGSIGLTTVLGAQIAPTLTPNWLYPRLTWGAIWGLLFFVPLKITGNARKRIIWQGLIVSLGPTLAQLLYFFPTGSKGFLGLQLGITTPLFVIVFNAIWGIVAAAWIVAAR